MGIEEKFETLVSRYISDYITKGDKSEKGTWIPFMSRNRNHINVGDAPINLAELLTMMILSERTGIEFPVGIGIKDVLDVIDRLFASAKEWGDLLGCPMRFEMNEDYGFFVRDDLDTNNEELKKMGITSAMSGWNMLHTLSNEDPCHSPFVSQDQVWNLSAPLKYIFMNTDDSVIANRCCNIGYKINNYIKVNGYKVYNPYLSILNHYYKYCPDFDIDFWERQADRYNNFKMTVKVKRGANNWYYSGGTSHCVKLFGNATGLVGKGFRSFMQSLVFLFLNGPVDKVYRLFGKKFKLNPVFCYGYVGCWFGMDSMSSSRNFEKSLVRKFNRLMKKGEAFEWNVLSLLSDEALKGVDAELVKKWLEDYEVKNHMEEEVYSPTDYICMYMIYQLVLQLNSK